MGENLSRHRKKESGNSSMHGLTGVFYFGVSILINDIRPFPAKRP
jgi:hypothetical protein